MVLADDLIKPPSVPPAIQHNTFIIIKTQRYAMQYQTTERRRLGGFESIDYLPPNSAVYRKWLARQPHRREWDRWLMMGAIGLSVGLVAYALAVLIGVMAEFKYGVTRWLILHANMAVAWLFNVTASLALVAASSCAVVYRAPAAVGSGVPEVMAYLNGVAVPKVFNIATVAVKVVSCGLCVASGLPVGPEGPLIHIGAALGAALSQGHSTTLGFTTRLFRRFRNPKDKRDFVTAGVAAGVAVAFNAPIGGLLFAFEEVASFWQHSLGWQIFFACMAATLTLNLARSAGKALLHTGVFGWFSEDVVFEAGLEVSSHVLAVLPAAAIGALAGVAGALFTMLNLRVCRARDALMRGAPRWRRCLEPCVLVAVYVTGSMVLPLFFPCTPTKCVIHEGQVYCDVKGGGGAAGGAGAAAAAAGAAAAAAAANGTAAGPGGQPLSLPLYTCSVAKAPAAGDSAWIPGSGTITPDAPGGGGGGGNASVVYYNELATLLLNTGDDGIKHLFSRGAHFRFHYGPLLVTFAWYALGAALAAGSAIASGLFVPMIMMGALLGRMVGLFTTEIAHNRLAAWVGAAASSNPWSWIDPGAFAMVGAGAFMASVTRLTVALAVIVVEISDDVHLLLPVLTGILVAKWVADAMVHPLYHALLEVKAAPFLAPEPVSRHSLDLVPVRSVMRAPVVTLRTAMRVADIRDVLRDTAHNGFPVVRDTPGGQVFVGLITRAHLMALLQRTIGGGPGGIADAPTWGRAPGGGGSSSIRGGLNGGGALNGGGGGGAAATAMSREVSWQELNRKQMDPVEAQGRRAQEAQMVALRRPSLDWRAPLAPALVEAEVDLTPYANTSAFVVPDSFSLERAYILFRSMGLRHLVVVDERNRVRGIVTRKDLLGFRLDGALGRALRRVASPSQLGDAPWIDAGADPTAAAHGGGGGGGGGSAAADGSGGGSSGDLQLGSWRRQVPQAPQAGLGQQQQQQRGDSPGVPVDINPIW